MSLPDFLTRFVRAVRYEQQRGGEEAFGRLDQA